VNTPCYGNTAPASHYNTTQNTPPALFSCQLICQVY